ncbi:Serine/threonine-protein kinase PknB [Planctomycetes bacterium Poly30]|uniref:Serine/threonine-protein kinase PknB n=1 Tax=Saltatorellus ferox TaxID=2528018 RepID=A0A518EQC3_9BACT|nr:Serine/threonine-protein kinase PknB [Planctomycetes bacterium Poly30]
MNQDDWTELRQLYDAALPLDDEAREAFLRERCEGRPEQLERLQRLLGAAARMDSRFLEGVAPRIFIPDRTDQIDPETLKNGRVGDYEIQELLGSGGMGLVFKAAHDGSKRVVALKTLRGIFASEDEMRRFRHEFQLLAQLNHPGIARFYEAGTHVVAGQPLPYYTMELVEDGLAITTYAARQRLPQEARLELMEQCAKAVHHGHMKGVIHRDLKPNNLLVDREGTAKVIDFGLARPQDSGALGLSALETAEGSLMGTLPYMSPEHLSGKPLAIDVRSDVYSLGCILWELLSGQPPVPLRDMSFLRAIAQLQQADPRPDAALPQELRWILSKAVSRDPSRRYGSAAEFAEDLARFRAHEPIEAAPPSSWYRIHRMARKYRAFLLTIASIIAALSFGLVRANQATARSEKDRLDAISARDEATEQGNISRTLNQFQTRMFEALGSYAMGSDVRVRDLLDDHVPKLEKIEDPRARLIAKSQLGRGYFRLGALPKAVELLESAKDEAALLFEPMSEYRLDIDLMWADLLEVIGRYSEAIEFTKLIKPRVEQAFGWNHPQYHYVLVNLGICYGRSGQLEEAEAVLQECLEVARAMQPANESMVMADLHRLGQNASTRDRRDEAEAYYVEALQIARDHVAATSLFPVTIRMDRATNLRLMGRSRDAVSELLTCKSDYERLEGSGRNQLQVRAALASALSDAGRTEEALTEIEEAEAFTTAFGDEPNHATFMLALTKADFLVRMERFEEAEPLLERSREHSAKVFGSAEAHRTDFLRLEGKIHRSAGRLDEAISTAREEWDLRKATGGERGFNTLTALGMLVQYLAEKGETSEALALARELVELTDEKDPKHAARVDFRDSLAKQSR